MFHVWINEIKTNTCSNIYWNLQILKLASNYLPTYKVGIKKDTKNNMTLMCVGEVTSRIKEQRFCNYEYKNVENLICEMEPTNTDRMLLLGKRKIKN